jgi:hypothetical protein
MTLPAIRRCRGDVEAMFFFLIMGQNDRPCAKFLPRSRTERGSGDALKDIGPAHFLHPTWLSTNRRCACTVSIDVCWTLGIIAAILMPLGLILRPMISVPPRKGIEDRKTTGFGAR